MESSTVDRAETPLEEDVGAKTVIEAFHKTAAEKPSQTAIRTRGDAFSIPYGALRQRVDKLAAGLSKLGLKKGDTLALMFPNQFEFHLADLAGMTIGATPFSLYVTASPEQIKYVVGDAGAKVAVIDQQFAERFAQIKGDLQGPRARRRRGRRRPPGRVPAPGGRRERPGPRLRRRGVRREGQAQGPPDADLHVGHDRAAEGRRADARQPHQVDRGLQAAHRLPARGARHLVAAERAHRRAQRAPLHPDRPRPRDHDLRGPAQDRRGPARGAAELVLRGARGSGRS